MLTLHTAQLVMAVHILRVTDKHGNCMHQVRGPCQTPCCVTPGAKEAKAVPSLYMLEHQADAMSAILLDLHEQCCIGLGLK